MKNLNKYIIKKNETLNYVSEKILSNNSRTVFVHKNFKILGVITEGDILRSLINNSSVNVSASDIMNKTFKFLENKNENMALKIFKKFRITIIPILDKNMKIKDIIEPWDII